MKLFGAAANSGLDGDDLVSAMAKNIKIYAGFNFIGTIFSCLILLSIVNKIIFNLAAEVKMPIDKWTIIDLVTATLNVGCFTIIGRASPEVLSDPSQKARYDYFVVAIIIFSWLRFFSYFLVMKSFSKFLMTFIYMVKECVGFIFIIACYLTIVATCYTMLFQEVNPTSWGSVMISWRYNFDFMLG